jgi:hypothetical protein
MSLGLPMDSAKATSRMRCFSDQRLVCDRFCAKHSGLLRAFSGVSEIQTFSYLQKEHHAGA